MVVRFYFCILLHRFQNKALGDTIYRVGCDLMRKLSSEDRLVGAINLANEYNSPFDKIMDALIAGSKFRATDESGNMLPSDLQFVEIYNQGIVNVFTNVCRFENT